jgi:hypothetical protein
LAHSQGNPERKVGKQVSSACLRALISSSIPNKAQWASGP